MVDQQDSDLILDYMKSRIGDFEKFLSEERGLSSHAATFIIEDLEYELKVKPNERPHDPA
jgi:hypothetical protein